MFPKEVFSASRFILIAAMMLPVSLSILSPLNLTLDGLRTDPVAVTATRTTHTTDDTVSTVRVLTREEILQRQAKSGVE